MIDPIPEVYPQEYEPFVYSALVAPLPAIGGSGRVV